MDNQILDEVNIAEAGYCLAVTEDDEVNVLASLLAKRAGTNQCMALINNSSYTSLLSNIGIDKYGRILCDVYLDNLLVNQWLIDKHYAIEYNGGTKKKVNWYDYMNEDYMTAGKMMR